MLYEEGERFEMISGDGGEIISCDRLYGPPDDGQEERGKDDFFAFPWGDMVLGNIPRDLYPLISRYYYAGKCIPPSSSPLYHHLSDFFVPSPEPPSQYIFVPHLSLSCTTLPSPLLPVLF